MAKSSLSNYKEQNADIAIERDEPRRAKRNRSVEMPSPISHGRNFQCIQTNDLDLIESMATRDLIEQEDYSDKMYES